MIEKHYYNNPLIRFDEEKNIFYFGSKEQISTLLTDSLNALDTLAILIDAEKVKNLDTINLKNSFMEIQITGDNNASEIKLTKLYKPVKKFSNKDYTNKAIKEFEKRVVKKNDILRPYLTRKNQCKYLISYYLLIISAQ